MGEPRSRGERRGEEGRGKDLRAIGYTNMTYDLTGQIKLNIVLIRYTEIYYREREIRMSEVAVRFSRSSGKEACI